MQGRNKGMLLELRRPKTAAFIFGAIALLFFSPVAYAKRGPKPVVPPIQVNGIEFRAPNSPESEGMIEAWDPTSNRLLWSRRVYRNMKDPLAEQDVQWVFIKSMSIAPNNQQLVIADERGRTHLVNIKPPVVRSVISQVIAIPGVAIVLWTLILLQKRRRRHSSLPTES
jgi:hypothetical protein